VSEQTPTTTRIGFGTDVLEDERVITDPVSHEAGDHERFSHYVPKDKLMEAMVNGTPVIALCGKVWVPSRDPQKFPVCPDCKDIWDGMQDDGPEGGSGPASDG
jgi:hypothetical protein